MLADMLLGLLRTNERVDIECNAIYNSYQRLQGAAMGDSVQDMLIENGLKSGRSTYVKVRRA